MNTAVGVWSRANLLLQAHLNLDPAEARARVAEAKELTPRVSPSGAVGEPVYPLLAAAQAAGRASEPAARMIRKTIGAKIPAAVRAEVAEFVEASLVEHAGRFPLKQLSRLALHHVEACDPDGREPRFRDATRSLRLHQRADGSGTIHGDLNAETMELARTALAAHTRPHAAVDGVKDDRTHEQRTHDGFHDILALAVRSGGLPRAGGVQTTVLVTMTAEQYACGSGLARTGNGALVPARDARTWGSGGSQQLFAVVLDKLRGISAYSTGARLFSDAQRLAMAARDKGCSFPGCDAPVAWTQAHHLVDHARHGPTSVDNGTLVCDHDHRERVNEGWTAHLIDGRVHWRPPPWHPDQTPKRNTLHD